MGVKKKPPESVKGSYTALPHAVLDCTALMGASHAARSLLLELMRQHNGSNNGHFQLTTSWLKKRGWASVDGIRKARDELLERGLIIQTRKGGLNMGADQYALTWLPIDSFKGLEVTANTYYPGKWHFMDTPLANKTAPPVKRNAAKRVVKKQTTHSGSRNSVDPSGGMADMPTVPIAGAKSTDFHDNAVPPREPLQKSS